MTNHGTKIVAAGVVAVAVMLAVVFVLLPGLSGGGLWGGPMVQLAETDGFTLIWREPGGGPAVVRIWQEGSQHVIRVPVEPEQDGWYRGRVEGLQPGTAYQYAIEPATQRSAAAGAGAAADDDQVLAGHTRTAPRPGGSFRFVVVSDSGEATEQQYALGELIAQQDPDLFIHTGDIVMPAGLYEEYPAKFLRPYATLIARAAVYPVLGNHDWHDTQGEPFYKVFDLPVNGPEGVRPEQHYWFDFGDARFIGINSNIDFESVRDHVAPWLDRVLADAGDRWKIVYCHHGIYTDGVHRPRGAFLEHIVPLLDRHGVDLALAGHNHIYERTRPMRAGEPVADGQGTVYMTVGTGGSLPRKLMEPASDFMAAADDSECSFTVVDASPAALHLRQMGLSGKIIDEFTLTRDPAAASEPAAATMPAMAQ